MLPVAVVSPGAAGAASATERETVGIITTKATIAATAIAKPARDLEADFGPRCQVGPDLCGDLALAGVGEVEGRIQV